MLSQRQPQAELQLQLQREYQQYPGWMPPVSRPGLSFVAILGLIGMTLMIGLRYDVGGDWNAYEFIFKRAGYRTFDQSLLQSD